LPNDWDKAKTEVILPFLESAVTAEPRMDNLNKELSSRLSTWRNKH